MLEALVKGLLLFGVVLLLGAGLFPRFVGRFEHAKVVRPLLRAALVGAALIIIFSALNILTTLYGVLGFLEPSLVWDYTLATAHGRATLVRIGLIIALVVLQVVITLPRRLSNTLYLTAGVGLLLSFSWVSHNASMGGWLPVIADLIHFAAASAWAAAVLYTAFLPLWDEAERSSLTSAMARVSRIGLTTVILLFLTGLYSAWLHVGAPSALVTTRYGWALVAKVGLVFITLGIAAINRWVLLPKLGTSASLLGLSRALKVEAGLLCLVLCLTGLLSTSPVPH